MTRASCLERGNPSLKGAQPKDYALPARAKDVLGRGYEYFLSQFASADGKRGGERQQNDKHWRYGAPPDVAVDDTYSSRQVEL